MGKEKAKVVAETYEKFYDLLSLVNEVDVELNINFPSTETYAEDTYKRSMRCHVPGHEERSRFYLEVFEKLRFWDNRKGQGISLWVKTGEENLGEE